MKKLLFVLFAIIIFFSLGACKETDPLEGEIDNNKEEVKTDNPNIV